MRGLLLAALLSTGCDLRPDVPNGIFACERDSDCPGGQTCMGAGASARCFAPGTAGDLGPPPCVPDGALDRPDGDYTDSDCDGIDGTLSASVFVSPSGDDLADGTREAPVRSVQRGIALAVADSGRDDVLIATGTYLEAVTVVAGVNLHGSYGLDWVRRPGATTTLRADGPVLRADDIDAPTRITGLRFVANDASQPGTSSIAGRVAASSGLRLEQVVFEAGDGAGGAAPAPTPARDADGQDGDDGGDGGLVHVDSPPPQPGAGGVATCGCVDGGRGGAPALSAGPRAGLPGKAATTDMCIDGAMGGALNVEGTRGTDGARGAGGALATEGLFDGDGYHASSADPGQAGERAGGGGGGGGSTAFLCDVNNQVNAFGGAGGGGGAGGCGGSGGAGGAGGGASVGLLLTGSEVTLIDVRITSGSGGAGGAGQAGQDGALGGSGAPGGLGGTFCAATPMQSYPPGARGGDGGTGGGGGGGAGGAGGPSVALLLLDGSTQASASSGVQLVVGSGGVGGAGGAGGTGGSGTEGAGAHGSTGSAVLDRVILP
ncbi:MAG: hypothetical protein H6726_29405 [Sandaracinaceae bacterium]|nr:hypothetical protein [Sandaracinaceae bacterium]